MSNDPKTLYNLANEQGTTAVLHLRFQGQSRDIALGTLAISPDATDDEVKMAVAQFLDVALINFDPTVVERHANGNLTLRPEAVFG